MLVALAISSLAIEGCSPSSGTGPPTCEETDSCPPPPPPPAACATIVEQGTDDTFDVATWNVEWFGSEDQGPTNELRQRLCVQDVIAGAAIDLWAVQEIVSPLAFGLLLDSLPDYEGLLANHPSVTNGPQYYNNFNGTEQKVGLIWNAQAVTVNAARVVLVDSDFDFAGRPPLEVEATVRVGPAPREVVVLVLHAKAGSDQDDYDRRRRAAEALQAYLDATWLDRDVWVLGDFNDDVDASIRVGLPSPYEGFVMAAESWRFVSDELSLSGASSTVGFTSVIDHLLVSNEVEALYEEGSADVLRLDTVIPAYGTTTSDHFPVFARFRAAN